MGLLFSAGASGRMFTTLLTLSLYQMYKNYILKASVPGRDICLDLAIPSGKVPFPVVMFLHGFKGFKDWGHFNAVSSSLVEAGIACCKFNFSHNGTHPSSPDVFCCLDAFAENNYSLEQEDCNRILHWLKTHESLQSILDINRIYLLGHSRGGAMGILFAAANPEIKKLVTWAAVADLEARMAIKQHRYWRDKGVIFTFNARTNQHMPMNYQFYLDYAAQKDRFNVLDKAASIHIPWLILHGVRDESVKINEARMLSAANKNAVLQEIPMAGHTFGVSHPYNGNLPDAAEKVLAKTVAFLKEN